MCHPQDAIVASAGREELVWEELMESKTSDAVTEPLLEAGDVDYTAAGASSLPASPPATGFCDHEGNEVWMPAEGVAFVEDGERGLFSPFCTATAWKVT